MRRATRLLIGAAAGFLLVGLVSVPPTWGATLIGGRANPEKCPVDWYCTTIPPACPQATCPEVEVGPDVDVGPDQWLYVNLYRFPPGQIAINYCSDLTALPAPPLCFTAATPKGVPPSAVLSHEPVDVEPFSNATSSLSFQVAEVSTLDPPLYGQHVLAGAPDPNEDPFYCDGTGLNPCSINVSFDTGQAPSVDNTAIVPIDFAPPNAGCPQAAEVNTESEFGINLVLPEAARLSCQGVNPSIAVNTEQDGLTAVTQTAQDEVQVAFTDDPESSDQQAQIKGNLSLIPVALSANVIGAKAVMFANDTGYPMQNWELTPNMVAGLISFNYPAFDSADLIPCPTGGCKAPPCETKTGSCSALLQLNAVNFSNKRNFFLDQQSYGTYVRSDQAGVTHQVFQWLCTAPNQPITIPSTGQVVTESMSGAQELMNGLKAYGYKGTTCPAGSDQFPKLSIPQTTQWSADAQPNQQANKLDGASGYVPPPGLFDPQVAGFATMNWAEADYYGLATASLQNAAGDFVAPTAASLDAALADATVNPDGSYSFNYDDTGDPNAYPLPDLIYAAVPTAPMPAEQATQVTEFLNQLLNLTAGPESSNLPPGFVPLPSALYQQALKDIPADIHVQPATTPTTTTPTSTSTPSAVTSYPPTSGAPQTFAGSRTVVLPQTEVGNTATAPAAVASKGPTNGPVPPGFSLASSSTRLFVPLTMVLAPLLVLLGLVLLLSEPARRHTAQAFGRVGRGIGGVGSAFTSGARRLFGGAGPGAGAG